MQLTTHWIVRVSVVREKERRMRMTSERGREGDEEDSDRVQLAGTGWTTDDLTASQVSA